MASMRLKQKWHAIIATAGAASFRMTGRSGPTVRAPGVRVVLVMAPEATGAPGRGSTSRFFYPAATAGFGVVQRTVRGIQERLERRPVARMHGDPDAHGERRLFAVPRHAVGDAPGHVPRRRVPGLGQDQRELVPAEPRSRVDPPAGTEQRLRDAPQGDRKSTRLNSSHVSISYAVFCLKKKKK